MTRSAVRALIATAAALALSGAAMSQGHVTASYARNRHAGRSDRREHHHQAVAGSVRRGAAMGQGDARDVPGRVRGGHGAELRQQYAAIKADKRPATFDTVIVPMQTPGEIMDRVQSMWGVYASNLANKEVQAIDREWSPKLSKFYDELTLDPALFAAGEGGVRHAGGAEAEPAAIAPARAHLSRAASGAARC